MDRENANARRGDAHPGPNLIDDAIDDSLTAERCDLEYWLRVAARDLLRGTVHGRAPELRVPEHMLEPGPLRDAMIDEFAFRAVSESLATRLIGYIVAAAPDTATLEFFTTQLFDEARHAHVFRRHLIELGLPERGIEAAIRDVVGAKQQTILDPSEAFGREIGEAGDFIGGVIMLTLLGEGALAPAAEMSERKWRLLDPPGGAVARGANADETRHLAVGTNVVRDQLRAHPQEKARMRELIERGNRFLADIPIADVIVHREALFQKGMEPHRDRLAGYELVPGRPLVETTVEERLAIQLAWSQAMRDERLVRMGLRED